MAEELGTDNEVEPDPLTDWAKEPKLRDLKADYSEALPDHQANVDKVQDWLDNLNITGKAKIKVTGTNSSVQPKLIRKQAEWRYAALTEPFLSTPSIFKVKPLTWEDMESAQQNELVLNNQFDTKLDKVGFIDEYVRTAVDEGTVILRVGWDSQEEKYTEVVPDVRFFVNPEFAPVIEQVAQLKEQAPHEFAELPDAMKEALELSIKEGAAVEPQVVGEKTVTKTRMLVNEPTLEVCDFRNVIVDPTCKGKIRDASFVIYEFESSLSELKKEGAKYKNLDKIDLVANSSLGDPDFAVPEQLPTNFSFADDARKKIVVREYWGFWDIDGSGKVQPIVAAWIGNTLIRMEKNPFPDKMLPFVTVQYLPVRKVLTGEPDGALLEENQKIIGAVTRGMIDLMGRSANAQQGTRKDALDIVNRRKFENGQDYEFNQHINDPRSAVYMHQFPDIPSSAPFMINMQNADAESMTGVKAFAGGLSGDSLGEVATGVRGVLDAASKRELGILRRLSQGLLEVARKFISMNQEFLSEEEVVRVTNDSFVKVRKDDLGGKFDLVLDISTAEDDNAKAKELAFMLQTVGPDEDPGLRKKILGKICRLRKMPDLAKDIEDYEPQPDPMQQEIQRLTVEKLKKEIQKLDSEAQENVGNAQLHAARAQTEGAKVGKIQSETDLNSLDFVEQESGVKQERTLQATGEQARSQAELKLLDRQFQQEDKMDEALAKAIEELEKFQTS